LAEALADDLVDVVIIATPHDLHYRQAYAALSAGKHVIVEVPITLNYSEADILVRIADERNLLLSVPYISRYLDNNIEAKRLIDSGAIGNIYQLIYRRVWLQRNVGHMMNRKRSWVDTVAWHHAAHSVDLSMWLLNEPMNCVGSIIGLDRTVGNETDLSANFITPSGVLVTLSLSYNARQNFMDTLILGEEALLEIEGFSTLKRQGEIIVTPEEALTVQGRAYGRYAAAVVAALRGEAPVPVSGKEVLPSMAQLQRIHDLAAQLQFGAKQKESV
jgi:2-hydroxy-4-carboxymuconate semialdehyde hemiacetal dehydrogenase